MTAAVVILTVLLFVTVVVLLVVMQHLGAARSELAAAPVMSPPGDADPISGSDSSLPRLVAALDALSLGVVVADANEVLGFRNRSAEAILTSHDARSIINRAIRELLVEAVRGEAGEREIELFGPPPTTYLIRAVPLLGEPAGGGGVAVVEDITERRRVDEVRRDFVSNISHELKTPVGAVGILADTLRDETDLPTIQRFSERMSNEVHRLSRTIDDLLELSRIEFADDLFIDLVPLGSIVDDALGRFAGAAEARDITLRFEGDRDLGVRGDRRQITSAISNLIDNAVKYSADGAEVVVSATVNGCTLAITVTDKGIGIPGRDLDRVFERFYRVDRARSRQTGGTGLGLAIVRHVAQNHGGDVSVRSKEGHGSVFTLSLPFDAAEQVGAPTEQISEVTT